MIPVQCLVHVVNIYLNQQLLSINQALCLVLVIIMPALTEPFKLRFTVSFTLTLLPPADTIQNLT